MAKVVLYEESSTPATPSEGVILYPTVATPSILRVKDDGGNDRALALHSTATWTPGVSFGGDVTGITYTTQVGRYTRIGDLIVATGYIVLSSKGSSTGTALITGLPVASANVANVYHAVALRVNVMSSITGFVMGFIVPNDTTVNLEFLGTGSRTTITDAHFQNTTTVMVTATYLAA